MKRRNFLVAWITGILYAIFPSLRPDRYLFKLASFEAPNEVTLKYAIGWHLEAEPLMFVVPGNVWTLPEGTTGGTRVTPAS